ncbi:ABC transporter G family member 24 [Striga hermonthica]|uniref:ABC transporter G family member 24 n=1 Tax=Striga hermonthica TaxID=68872 RepID=A0A9N7NI28_STRHE|nr:ABC transporter G family member 24 [Striga hermonthica]
MDTKSADASLLKPNKKCNLRSWVPGCEPGWASTFPQDAQFDIKNSKDFPDRTREIQPRCAGFFCPRGLTCMIHYPLGSYYPRAALSKATGNHMHINYLLLNFDEIFCSAGSYCPTTTQKTQCHKLDFFSPIFGFGTLSKVKGDTFGYYGYTYTVIAVSLLCKISALRSFSLDKLQFGRERESESGMSCLAYFLSKETVDHFNTLIKPLDRRQLGRTEVLGHMEDGPVTIGFEDETMDVDCLLDEKIPEKAMGMDDICCHFGVTNAAVALERENILSRDVLDSVSSEADVGYFRLHNDFCSMGEDYLLGVRFSESITNLDYGPSEGLLTSVSDSSVLPNDLFTIMELPDSPNDQLNIDTSDFGEVPNFCNESETPIIEKPPKSPVSSSTSHDIDKFHNISSNSLEMLLDEKDDEFGPTGQNMEPNRSEIKSSREECTPQKRSRKPTKRYIDELVDPIPKIHKKRREFLYSAVKDNKNCHMGSSKVLGQSAAEDSSVVAIQVPFGSLVHKECPKRSPSRDMHEEIGTWHKRTRSTDRGHSTLKSKDKKGRDRFITAVYPMKIDCSPTSAANEKKSELFQANSPKKNNCMKTTNKIRREEYANATETSSEEASGRRKHHRLWTVSEVKKLIDGVSEYGVGRWSRIKKLLFSASAHRTSVDLKDKWRNLLKASHMQLGNQQVGENKRNMAWRPLPKSILRRVCELANMYPYPKCRTKHKITRDSPDRNTDLTLTNYRRILQSINGN